ncbi:hypothetical protein B0O99DRAFT_633565 [Bisporella sp. PMI_857]|nr:hypothetical protein B0O99DRAFT_633565 [Bisporella sp. PMI_857]
MLSTMSYNEESTHRVSHSFSPFDRSETPTCNPVSPIPPAETPPSGSATLSPLWNERSSTAGSRRYSTNNDFRWEDYPIPVSTTIPSLQSFTPMGRRPRSETLAEMENLSVAVELPAESCSSARHMSVPQMSFPAELSSEISAKEREMLDYRAYKQKPASIEKPTGSKMRVDIPPSLKPGHLESRNTYPAPPITSYSQFSMTRHLPDQPIEMPHHLHFAAKPPAPYPTEPRMTLTHVSSDPVVPGRRTQMPLQPRPGSMVFPKGFSQNGRGRPY